MDRFAQELPHVVIKYRIKYKKFNHLDFLWANDVKTLLYDETMNHMSHY